MNKDEKVLLAWCDSGNVTGEFALSIFMNMPSNVTDVLRSKGIKIATQRQEIFDAFMNKEFDNIDWLLMVDSDIVPSKEDIEELFLSADRYLYPVVSGLYFTTINNIPYPCYFINGKFGNIYSDINKDMLKIDSSGLGLFLIHRSVCKKLIENFTYQHFFLEEQDIHNHSKFIGEDVVFCNFINSINIPIYLNTNVRPKHLKTVEIDFNYYQNFHGNSV